MYRSYIMYHICCLARGKGVKGGKVTVPVKAAPPGGKGKAFRDVYVFSFC